MAVRRGAIGCGIPALAVARRRASCAKQLMPNRNPRAMDQSPLPLPPVPPRIGIWAVFHEVRSEYAQLLTTAFLLINASPTLATLLAVVGFLSAVNAGGAAPVIIGA